MNELNIPDTWAVSKISQINSLQYGKNLPTKKLTNTGYPVFGANGQIGFYTEYHFEEPQVLITCRGATCGTINISLPKSFITNNSITVIPKKNELYSKKFLEYALIAVDTSKVISGSAQPQITLTNLDKIMLPVPPRSEQERIVKTIDFCFDQITQTHKGLCKLVGLFEKLSIAYQMQAGEWLSSVSLEMLTEERTQRVGVKNSKHRKIGVDNKLGVVDLRVTGKNTFEKYKIVKKGDILYNPMRVNVGSIALYLDEEDAITSPDYIVFSVRNGYSAWLIYNYLKSPYGADEISKKLTGSVRERLYYKKLKEIPFPNPDRRIHMKAEKHLNGINLEVICFLSKINSLLDLTKKSVLKKAFEGRLVPQLAEEGTGHDVVKKIMELN